MRRFLISFTMHRVLVSSLFAAALLPVTVLAQHGGGAGGHAVAAPAAAPHAAMHASGPAPRLAAAPHASLAGHYVRTRTGAVVYRSATHSIAAASRSNDSRRILSQDVPGLGFDYPHLAAIGGGRGRGRGFFPGRDRNHPFLAYFPFYGGGYLPLYDDYDETPATDEQQAEAAEPDYYPGNYPPPPRPGDTPEGFPAPAPAQMSAASPDGPVDEYVFVRRDGTLFFAVAYTWDAGNLRYVTSEGLRRSVAGDALDLDATQQFNEQRGLSFRIPTA